MPPELTALEIQPGRLQAQALAGLFLRKQHVEGKQAVQDIQDDEAGWPIGGELTAAKGVGGCQSNLCEGINPMEIDMEGSWLALLVSLDEIACCLLLDGQWTLYLYVATIEVPAGESREVGEGKGHRVHQAKCQVHQQQEQTANAVPVRPTHKSVETMHEFLQIFQLVSSSGEIRARAHPSITACYRFYVERRASLTLLRIPWALQRSPEEAQPEVRASDDVSKQVVRESASMGSFAQQGDPDGKERSRPSTHRHRPADAPDPMRDHNVGQ